MLFPQEEPKAGGFPSGSGLWVLLQGGSCEQTPLPAVFTGILRQRASFFLSD